MNFKFVEIMIKKVKNSIKKLGKAYMKGVIEMYGPVINAGLNPFI